MDGQYCPSCRCMRDPRPSTGSMQLPPAEQSAVGNRHTSRIARRKASAGSVHSPVYLLARLLQRSDKR
jgi:hypothetical protein